MMPSKFDWLRGSFGNFFASTKSLDCSMLLKRPVAAGGDPARICDGGNTMCGQPALRGAIRFLAIGLAVGVGFALEEGCTQVRQAEHSMGMGGGVPKSARKIASGTGAQGINTSADKAGTLFINDDDKAEVVFKGDVHMGESIIVDGQSNTVSVGESRKDVKLDKSHTYSVYIQ